MVTSVLVKVILLRKFGAFVKTSLNRPTLPGNFQAQWGSPNPELGRPLGYLVFSLMAFIRDPIY